ncbi:MAG: prolipoprotein diacylglyceryl transferase [Clostridiales bacterium]|jgi:phosphatidylglycerol:prolipoprotein diacylglycerol transferase|nr:prolipoprotein diacylglyceryl transferase [Clostridiales bacterium]
MNIIEFPKLGLDFKINPEIFTFNIVIKWYGVLIFIILIVALTLFVSMYKKHNITKKDILNYVVNGVVAAAVGGVLCYIAYKVKVIHVMWYGVLICVGFLAAVALGLAMCRKRGISQDDLLDYILFATPAALVGARLYYVAFSLDVYMKDPKSIFYINEGGLAIYGGVIFAVVTVFITAKVKKQSFLKIMDFAIPFIALGQAVGRWGNFTNQEAFGRGTELPWGMTGNLVQDYLRSINMDSTILVHPTFLYESIWCLGIFIFLMIYTGKFKKANGEVLCLYMITYGIERALVEGLRLDSLMIYNKIRVSQLLSVLLIIIGIALFIDVRRRYRISQEDAGEHEDSGLSELVEQFKSEEIKESGGGVPESAKTDEAEASKDREGE